MKTVKVMCYAFAGAIILSAALGMAADKQQDRLKLHIDDPQYQMDQDRLRDQDRDQLRIHQDDPQGTQQQLRHQNRIYGAELMTADEQAEYRRQYAGLQSMEEKNRFEYQHRLKIQNRAKAAGVSPPEETTMQTRSKAGALIDNSPSGSDTPGSKGSSTGGQRGGSESSGGSGSSGNGGGGSGGGRK